MNTQKREAAKAAAIKALETEIASEYPCIPVLVPNDNSFFFDSDKEKLFPTVWLDEINDLSMPFLGSDFWEHRFYVCLFLLELLETEEEGTNYHE